MASLRLQQNSLHEEAARLSSVCDDLVTGDRQRDKEMAELHELLSRVKQINITTNTGESVAQQSGPTSMSAMEPWDVWNGGSTAAPFAQPELSPSGRTPMPRVVQSGLGALSSANKTLSAFQSQLDTGLTQLQHQAGEARRSATTVRAHVDFLQQLVSPGKGPGGVGGGALASSVPQAGSPASEEMASLLRVLQEAAQQRAMAESSLCSPSPGSRGPWDDDANSSSLFAELQNTGGFRAMQPGLDLGSSSAAAQSSSGLPGSAESFPAPWQRKAQSHVQHDADYQNPQHFAHRVSRDTHGGGLPDQATRDETSGVWSKTGVSARPDASATPMMPTAANMVDQGEQLLRLQSSVQILEVQRKELVARLEDTSAKVSSCTIELEAVRLELGSAKAELAAQQSHLQAVHAQRQAADQSLQTKLEQLRQLDTLVQASAAQLAGLEATIAAAFAAGASTAGTTAMGAAVDDQTKTSRSQRTRRRVKRHIAVRRSRSCSDLSATQPAPSASQEGQQPAESEGAPGLADAVECLPTSAVSAMATAPASGPSPAADAGVGGNSAGYSPDRDRLEGLQRELLALTAEHSKAVLQLEQERHAGAAQQCELAAIRQKLRAQQAATVVTSGSSGGTRSSSSAADNTAGSSGVGASSRPPYSSSGAGNSNSLKRPLSVSMSGMEELLEEVAADLEQLEGHVATATQRLLNLQAQSLGLAQQVSDALRRRAEAEAQAGEELRRAQALRSEADKLQRSIVAGQQSSSRLATQLSAARADLQQLERQAEEQLTAVRQGRTAVQEAEAQAQEVQRLRLQEEHGRSVAEQARRAAEHDLQQLQARMEEAELRSEQAEQDAAAARVETDGLLSAAQQARQDASRASEELQRCRIEAASAQSQLAATTEELAIARQQRDEEDKAATAATKQREESEALLQACLDELQRARLEVQQGEEGVRETQVQLSKLRQEQQELVSTVERHEQQAAAAERGAAAAQQDLGTIREQVATAQRQVAELTVQVAALQGVAAGFSSRGMASGSPSVHATPGTGFSLLGHAGPFAAPALEQPGGFHLGGPMGHYAAHQHLATIVQLQAETERLQVSMVQAQSRQRLAEQRAADAEQMCSELQARLSGLRAQQHHTLRADLDGPPPASASVSSAVHSWRAKADDLQQELDASQHLLGRYKTRLAAAQEESSSLEESLQRERAAAGRLRQQLDGLQQELHAARVLQQKQQQLQLQQQAPQREAGGTGGTASPAAMLAAQDPGLGNQVERAAQELRKLQSQVARQQDLHSELLEEHTALRRQGGAMRQQMEEAAGQLVALKAQYEKGKLKVEQLKAQQAELQGRVSSLAAQEQAARSRVEELQRQAAAQDAGIAAQQQAGLAAQQQLRGLESQVAAAQQALASMVAERDVAERVRAEAVGQRDAAVAQATEAERRAKAGPMRDSRLDAAYTDASAAASDVSAAAAAPVQAAAAAAERLASLEKQLTASWQAAAATEEHLAEERRQLQQCKGELAAALTVRASHDAATARLQQDLEKLQAQVAQLQDAKGRGKLAVATATTSAATTPVGPGRHLAMVPRDDASPSSTPALALQREAVVYVPSVWEGTPSQLAEARRELHSLQLRIAVACADEARLTAACAELRRQQAVAEQDVNMRRQQVLEAEQRLGFIQARAAQGVKEAEAAVELAELRDQVRTSQQAARSAEAAEAEAKHQTQLAAMRLAHAEDQVRLQQQQTAVQTEALAERLSEAQASCDRERQRASVQQQRVEQLLEQLQQQAADHAATLHVRAQEHAAALQDTVQEHGSSVAALQTALSQVRSREAVASAALVAARAEVSRLQVDVHGLSTQLAEAVAEAGASKEQLRAELARAELGLAEAEATAARWQAEHVGLAELLSKAGEAKAQALAGAGTEMERLRAEMAQLAVQDAEQGAALVQAEEKVLRSAAALVAVETEGQRLRAEVERLQGALAITDTATTELLAAQRILEESLSAEREKCDRLRGRASDAEVRLAGAEASAERLRLELKTAKAEATEAEARACEMVVTGPTPGTAPPAMQAPPEGSMQAHLHLQLPALDAELHRLRAEVDAVRTAWAVEAGELRGALVAREVELAQLQDDHRHRLDELQTSSHSLLAAAGSAQLEQHSYSHVHAHSQLQHEALGQLLADCEALRGQRDAALSQLSAAVEALGTADVRAQELVASKEQLEADIVRLQQLVMGAMAVIEEQQGDAERQRGDAERQQAVGMAGDQRPAAVVAIVMDCAVQTTGALHSSQPAEDRACQTEQPPAPTLCDGHFQTGSIVASSQVPEETCQTARQTLVAETAVPGPATGGDNAYPTDRAQPAAPPAPVQVHQRSQTDPGIGGAMEAPAEASSTNTRSQQDADAYAQLLRALGDRAVLEHHVTVLQAQLQAALQDRSVLEYQAGGLEAQLSQLQCDQEQQLVLMHMQIEALRGQLLAWRTDREADVEAMMQQPQRSQEPQEPAPALGGGPTPAREHTAAETQNSTATTPLPLTSAAAGRRGISSPERDVAATPACTLLVKASPAVSTAIANVGIEATPITPGFAPRASVSPTPSSAAFGASPLDVARLQGHVVELTSRLQRSQRDAAAAERRAAILQQQAEAFVAELESARDVEGQAREALLVALAERAATAEQVAALEEELEEERMRRVALAAEDAAQAVLRSCADACTATEPPPQSNAGVQAKTSGICMASGTQTVPHVAATTTGTMTPPPGTTTVAATQTPAMAVQKHTAVQTNSSAPRLGHAIHVAAVQVAGAGATLSCDASTQSPPEVDPQQALLLAHTQLQEQSDARARLEEELSQLRQRQEAELQAEQAGEVERLQGVHAEFSRLESQLKSEQERAQAVAAAASEELRSCQRALAASEQQAREAVQEALRATQQASAFLMQLSALRQRMEHQGQEAVASATHGAREVAGRVRSSGGEHSPAATALPAEASLGRWVAADAAPTSHPHIPHPTYKAFARRTCDAVTSTSPSRAAGGAQKPPPPQPQPELQPVLAAEIQRLQRHCAAVEKQGAVHQEELRRTQSRLAAAEARYATAVKQIAALNAELRTHAAEGREAGAEEVRAVAEEEVLLRVAQQAAEDARLLCAVQGQLGECREQLGQRSEELEAARAELGRARVDAEQGRAEIAGIRVELEAALQELQAAQQLQQHQQQQHDPEAGREGASALQLSLAIVHSPASRERVGAKVDTWSPTTTTDAANSTQQPSADAVRSAVRRVLAVLAGPGAGRLGPGRGCHAVDSDADLPYTSPRAQHGALAGAMRRLASPTHHTQSYHQLLRRFSRRAALVSAGSDAEESIGSDDACSGYLSRLGDFWGPGDEDYEEGLETASSRRQWTSDLTSRHCSFHQHATGESAAPSSLSRHPACGARLGQRATAQAQPHFAPIQRAPLLQGTTSGLIGRAAVAHNTAAVACQTDVVPGASTLPAVSRVAAATAHLSGLQQQQSALLAQVAVLQCQAAEAGALATARSERVAALQAREQQLAAAVSSLRHQAQQGLADLEEGLARCQAAGGEACSTLDSDCRQLRELRSGLVKELEGARSLLRESVGALRLSRASLAARQAVDASLASLATAAAADAGANGPQAVHHVRVVFSCMSELCGKADALSSALAPLVSRLGALNLELSSHGCGPAATTAPSQPAGNGTGGKPGTQQAAGVGHVAHTDVEEVRRTVKLVYRQLHSRARKFAGVLKAVAAGQQLPADGLHDGFQRLWSSTEEQLGGLLRLTSMTSKGAGAGGDAGSRAARTSPEEVQTSPGGPPQHASSQVAPPASHGASLPASGTAPGPSLRAPLEAVENRQELQPQQQNLSAYKRGGAAANSGNRKMAAGAAARMAGSGAPPVAVAGLAAMGGADSSAAAYRQPHQSPKRGAPASPPARGRQQPRRRQQQQHQQPHGHHDELPGGEAARTKLAGAANAAGAGVAASEEEREEPQRRRMESQLQHVLSLARRLQSGGRAPTEAPQSRS